MYNMTCVV